MSRVLALFFNRISIRNVLFVFFGLILIVFNSASVLSFLEVETVFPLENSNYSVGEMVNVTFNVSCYNQECNDVYIGIGIKNASAIYSANGMQGIDTYYLQEGELNHTYNIYVNDYALSIWSDENYIYSATGGNGLSVFSIDNLGRLNFLDNNNQGGYSTSVFGCESYIYVADSSRGLDVYSINESGLNHLYNSFFEDGSAYGVWCDENYIYLANSLRGLDVYSLNESGLNHLYNDHQEGGSAISIWGDGNYIYLSDEYRGLDVYSLNESGLNHLYNDHQEGGFALSIWGDGNHIYLANGLRGIDIYSINESGLNYISNIPSREDNSEAYFILGDEDYIYLADGDNGLEMYSIEELGLEHIYHDYQGGYSSSLLKRNQNGILTSFFREPFLIDGEESFLINLEENYSMILNFELNATGEIGSNVSLFGYSYMLSDQSSLNISENIILRIVNNSDVQINESLEETPQEESCSSCGGGGGGGSANIKQKNNTLNECVYDVNFDWGCSEWSNCVNDIQTRVCKEINNCGNNLNKPIVYRSCISNKNPKKLFDIKLDLNRLEFENITQLQFFVSLESFGSVPTQVDLNYSIIDSFGNKVYSDSEKIVVQTQEIFSEKFEELDLGEGNYTLFLTTTYGDNVYDEFRKDFRIVSEKNEFINIKYLWVVFLIFIMSIFYFSLFYKNRKTGGKI